MKKQNAFYAFSMMLIALTMISCDTKKKTDPPAPIHSDSISVSKVQPSIDSISVVKAQPIDSISGKAK